MTDPRSGLPRTVSWLPTVKEVSDACEAEKKFLANKQFMEGRGWRWTGSKWQKPGEAA